MGRRTEQTIFQRGNTDSQQAREKMFNITNCRVRELEEARFGKRIRPALHRNRSPLMRREGAAVRLESCCTTQEKSKYI